jgi:hypothetical protein
MRYRSPDGVWTVDVIHLTLTGTGRDGERLRVKRRASFEAELRTIDELRAYVDPADLEEEAFARRVLRVSPALGPMTGQPPQLL